MTGSARSASIQPFVRLVARLKSERLLSLCLRVGTVVVFSWMMGYWAAMLFGEFFVNEQVRMARALLNAPHSASARGEGAGGGALTLKDFVVGDPFLVRSLLDFGDESREITAGELFDLEGV